MQRVVAALFIVVGLINVAPITGLLSADVLASAYGIAPPEGDLLILLRHRALLFGIVGGLLIVAAFRRHLQPTAIIAGLASMIGFIVLTLMAGGHGDNVHRIMLVDIGAVALLAVAMALRLHTTREPAQ